MPDAQKYITQFDSSTSMLYALANALKDQGFKGAGIVPGGFRFVPAVADLLSFRSRQGLYRWSGWWTALSPDKLRRIKDEEIAQWVTGQYPRRQYPVILIGSSNGAAVHLAAALDAPWLPQTFLVAVRRKLDPDDIEGDIAWGREAARVLRENNAGLKINQMHDPVQDRLMIAEMAYFRIKKKILGAIYERFILERLRPGGTILILDGRLPWPMIQVADGQTFQVGGLGALSPKEYLQGSARVEAFLHAHGLNKKKCWPLPGNVFEEPESEWGFYAPLAEDVRRFANIYGYRVRRIVFEEPESLSPCIADLYREWYRNQGLDGRCLLVECFALIEPWLTLRSGSIPFWLAFNTQPSLEALESYLENGREFDTIYLTLMSNGVDGIGQVPIRRWKRALTRARLVGEFLGVDEEKYPLDFKSFILYHDELKKKIKTRRQKLPPLTLEYVDRFIAASRTCYPVEWD